MGPCPISDEGEVEALVEASDRRIRAASEDPSLILSAIESYLDRGEALGCSPFELWDHFAISSPSIPQRAGCDPEIEEWMVALFETRANARWERGPAGAVADQAGAKVGAG